MPHRPNSLISTKNCYRTVDGFVRRKKKKNLIKERCYKGEKKLGEKREERQIEREICGKRRGQRG